MTILRAALVAAMLGLAALDAAAADIATQCKNHYILDERCFTESPTLRIKQLYSNLDGSIQYIELVPIGLEGLPISLTGRTLTSRRGGVVKTFTFPADPPEGNVANTSVIIAAVPEDAWQQRLHSTVFNSNLGSFGTSITPNYYVPARFLGTDGGVLDFDGLDAFAYARLPTDGFMALFRDGRITNGRIGLWFTPEPRPVGAIEYYHPERDHYFLSASAPDIDALDSGRIAGWVRTGKVVSVGVAHYNSLGIEYSYYGVPVCRIYLPPGDGDSHFHSASPDECAATLQRQPTWVLESAAAFYAALPDPGTGECGVMPGFVDGDIPLTPVYRLWNRRADTNHRYTTSLEVRDEMIARGWVPEGYGPMGVVMCN